MSVYLAADIEVVDGEAYAEYVERLPEVIHKYGSRYLVQGGSVAALSGDWGSERIILVGFETVGRLQACYGSHCILGLHRAGGSPGYQDRS